MSFTQLDLIMLCAVLGAMLMVLFIAGRVTSHFGLNPELKRKIVHVLTGLVSLSFPWLFSSALPVIIMIACSLLTMAALRSPWLKTHAVSTVLHDVQRKSFGEFYLLISVGLLFTLYFGREAVLYVLPLAIIALSDTASALIGTRYGRKHFTISDGQKSIEGGVAFFTVTLLVSLIVLMLLTNAPDINIIALSVLLAGFTTAVESDSWRGLDNIFVPVGAHILLARLLYLSPQELCFALLILGVAIIVMHKLGPLFRLTPHMSRAYTLLILLILSPSPNAEILFILLAIGAHLLARRTSPADNPNMDMEMIGMTSAVAMMWLFLDRISGMEAHPLFNLSFAGAVVIFMGVFFLRGWRILTPVIAVIICLLYTREISMVPIISLSLCTVVVMVMPKFFSRYRAVKAYSFAVIVPLITYAIGQIP